MSRNVWIGVSAAPAPGFSASGDFRGVRGMCSFKTRIGQPNSAAGFGRQPRIELSTGSIVAPTPVRPAVRSAGGLPEALIVAMRRQAADDYGGWGSPMAAQAGMAVRIVRIVRIVEAARRAVAGDDRFRRSGVRKRARETG